MSAEARSFRTRHAAKRTAHQLAKLEPEAKTRFEQLAAPIREQLLAEHHDLTSTAREGPPQNRSRGIA
jgi:ABC-type Zn uptake system ZnuABC Zn-binding protein ZnuA